MLAMSPPHEPFTDHALKLLAAVQHAGDWIPRSAIARALGKNRLTPYDHALLDRLTEAGKLEIRKLPHPSPIGFVYEYRAARQGD